MRVAILLLNSGRGSGEIARQQARYLASSGCQVYFIHPGVGKGVPGAISRDPAVARKYALPETYVICPGALTKSKGPQNVVEATREYAAFAPTIFIGDGDLRQQIESDLNGRGRLLGFVSDEDKAALINAASVLTAAPEKKEHFGIIYAEGLAAGTPSVAYEGGGVSSIVTPETGILTARDPKSLGRAVRALLADPERLEMMANAGRRRAEENFSWTMLGERLKQWLARLCS